MEHTFAYRGHEDVWRRADPYTPMDIHALDAHCRSRGIELVANQNTLGHYERWLRLDRYRPLAIAPDGFDWIFGIRRPALTLDPANPEAFELVSDLLGQLVPQFESPRVHVGLDEPWELGAGRRGRMGAMAARPGPAPGPGTDESSSCGATSRRSTPSSSPSSPMASPCASGDTRATIPSSSAPRQLEEAGVPFWVCPGTSSWMSISGRVDNMIENIGSAATAGVAHGAGGLLVTDWGDMGHHQQPCVSDPGFATAAAFGWCVQSHADLDADELAALLDAHCYDDPTGLTGRAVVGLGQTYRMIVPRPPNMSALALPFLLPQWPMGKAVTDGLTTTDLDAVGSLLDDTDAALEGARPRRADGRLVIDEIRATAALLRLSGHDLALRLGGDGTLASVSQADRDGLAAELGPRVEEFRRLWLERFRPGGLADSTAWFDHVLDCYRTGHADRAWFGPFG